MFYSQKTIKSICGIIPKSKPITNSFGVWAFISNLDDATKPFIRTKKAMAFIFRVWLWILNPITKRVKALMATIWRLAFILKNNSIKANNVLNNPPKKKKWNSGKWSNVMLFRTNKIAKKHWITNGILRCDRSENRIESTNPAVRNTK